MKTIPDERKEFNKALLEKGEVFLKIKLNSEQDAEQIYKWFLKNDTDNNFPITSELLEISWNKRLIDKDVFNAVKELVDVIQKTIQ